MVVILLIVIYLAFISLGLPDSLLGVAWPSIMADWNLSLDSAGLVSMFIVGGTIISSFLSGYVIKKAGTGKIVLVSCLMTGLSLLGFSLVPSYIWLLLLSIPLGLGGGTVDSALNNYVALHYKSHHMNWLHSFWGVGATLGPVIMGQVLSIGLSWQRGYRIISIIQLFLAAILFISLPLWKTHQAEKTEEKDSQTDSANAKIIDKEAFKIRGVKFALLTFMFYCAVEMSVGLWGSSYLIETNNLSVDAAAFWIAVYFGSITVGRFLSGFISFKLSNKTMIRAGIIISLVGAILLLIPLPNKVAMTPLVLIGLGLSPIFPAMIHETPSRFGKEKSQTIIGYQMAFAYIGSAFLPPLFGMLIEGISMIILPVMLVLCILFMLISSERINAVTKK